MKLEIDNDNATYRLVDGEEGTDSYVTGDIVDFGEPAQLEKDGEELPWEALIEEDGNFDGVARQGDTTVTCGFEFGCDFEDDDEE